jgi:hypothetical protein
MKTSNIYNMNSPINVHQINEVFLQIMCKIQMCWITKYYVIIFKRSFNKIQRDRWETGIHKSSFQYSKKIPDSYPYRNLLSRKMEDS